MRLKYKCLVIDHDDTVVNSTAEVHFKCFCKYLKEKMPHIEKVYTLNEYILKNFESGIVPLLRDELRMSEEDMRHETQYWAEYVEGHLPRAYEGLSEILWDFHANGGIIAVSSHSMKKYIIRDYLHNDLPMPHEIYSCDLRKDLVKPSPFAVLDVMERHALSPKDILVLDDMKTGFDMARASGVSFAAAGWAHDIPEIESFMREHCDIYLKSPTELREFLLEE